MAHFFPRFNSTSVPIGWFVAATGANRAISRMVAVASVVKHRNCDAVTGELNTTFITVAVLPVNVAPGMSVHEPLLRDWSEKFTTGKRSSLPKYKCALPRV